MIVMSVSLGRLSDAAPPRWHMHGCDCLLQDVVHTGLFSMEAARQSPGWLSEPRGQHVPETVEYGVTSLLYRRDR